MQNIINGIGKFQRDVFPSRAELFRKLARAQHPGALFVTCSDSRVAPEWLTQCEPGELFVVRNAGNIIPPYGPSPGGVSATVEYGVAVLGVSDIIVCGHSDCGAMTAIAKHTSLDHLPAVASWLRYVDAAKAVSSVREHSSPEEQVNSLVRENVIAQLNNLRTHPSVALALARCQLNLHGWVFDIETGCLSALDGDTKCFVPLDRFPQTCATRTHTANSTPSVHAS